MGSIHIIKVKSGSSKEAQFTNILKSVDVDLKSVLCKPGYLFWKPYDEYILSDGLWRQIKGELAKHHLA